MGNVIKDVLRSEAVKTRGKTHSFKELHRPKKMFNANIAKNN